ncbi:hypothetical protein RSA11_15925 [Exiguobacterium indicum]|uniref:Uncharacterized protein n=1 Tax=Exiguobacterium indicum TaxID=296995 RepID=A0AAW3M998_9BACL|nr:hypothetical protein RSA11_15925 [Exiguobacterium indicum]
MSSFVRASRGLSSSIQENNRLKQDNKKKRVKASETVVLKQTVQGETIEQGTYDIEYLVEEKEQYSDSSSSVESMEEKLK